MINNEILKNIADRRSVRRYKDMPVEDNKPILGIPDDKYVVAIITLGYGDETPDARPRRDLEEIVMFEKWDR